MKKKLLLFSTKYLVVFIVLLSFNIRMKAQGTCATATNIASLPYTVTGLTNCGKGANYSGTPACLTATNFVGEDYVFKYTPATTGCVNAIVTISGSPWNSGFAVLDRCPTAAGAVCLGTNPGALGATSLSLFNLNLTAGTTYYFVVSGGQSLFASPPNECFGFDFKLMTCPVPPPPLPTDPQGIECGSNLGFEDGNLNGWTGYTGVNTQAPATTGLVPGVNSVNGALGTCTSNPGAGVGSRHTLTTGGGFDPNTDNVVPVVAPGCRTNSLRIGNHEAGYQSEAMEKTFLVTTSNVLFTYLYAVVLQNPAGHTTANQPRFDITIKANGGAVISCGGIYEVTADNALSEGFTKATNPPCGAPDVWYKNWTAVGTDLTPYIGQNVTIRFTTVDCAQGGHFGYAYVDTYCKPKEITGTNVCTTGGNVTLSAPQGFTDYVWSPGGATGQTITVNNPVNGTVYTVSFKSIVGASCVSTVTDTITVVDATVTGDTTICSGATGTKQFTTTSSDAASTYSWTSTPVGFTSSSPNPTVTLPTATTVYKVTVTSPLGCTVTKSVTITVNPPPAITVNSSSICQGLSTSLTASGGDTYLWSTAATTTAITVSPASTTSYTVTGTSALGCTNSAVATVTIIPPPVPTASVNTPCAGDAINLTSTTGTSWSWTGPNSFTSTSQNPSIPSSTAAMNGTYTVIATESGCTGSATVNVTVNPLPLITVNSPTICPTTSATLTATGGTTYLWSTGQTINPITVTPASTASYTVTGTTLGCSASAVATVTVSPPCGVNVTTTPATICNGACEVVTATANSGTPPYTYLWNTGETVTSVSACPTVTTSYTVTVTDNASNTASAIAVITVNPNPVVSVSDAAICLGGSTTLTATGADTYSWSPATGLSPATGSPVTANPTSTTTYTVTGTIAATGCTGTTTVVVTVDPIPTITVPGAGICSGGSTPLTAGGADTYTWTPAATLNAGTGTTVTASPTVNTTYTITGTTTAGCTGSTTAVVTVGALVADAGPDAPICSGASTTLGASGGTTYSWTPATNLSDPNIFNPIANPTVTTTYTVTVTSGICTDTDEMVVIVDPPISLNIAGFPPKCTGGTDGQAVVIPSGGDGIYTYQWAPVTGSGASVNGPAGTYSVTVTDLFGCSNATSVVIVDPTPVIGTTSVITANCNKSDGSATVATVSGGTPGYTYSWNTTPVQNTQTASAISTGNYIVTITDANGCTATLAAFVPNAGGVTVSTTQTNVTCFGGNNGSATAAGVGGTQPYTYSWNNGQNTDVANTLIAGTYTVTITDVNGCSATTTAVITQPTQVVVTSTSGSMCPLTSATIAATGSGGTGAISYEWNPGALTGSSISVSPANTTVYTLTGTDANGCTGTTTATVTVNPNPVISVPNATICYGTSTPLTASGATSYSWAPVTGLTPATGGIVTANPTINTTYTVTGTDANGCTGSTTVVVTVNPLPSITVPPASICPGDTTTLTASGTDTYTWSPSSGLSSTTGASVIASPSSTTTYVVTGTNSFGCTAVTTTIVTVNPKPDADFTASPNPASVFDPTVYFTDQTNGSTSWIWSLGDLNNTGSTIKNPTFTYPDSIGKYTIQLIVTNQYGCIDTTWGTIDVKGEYSFFIPNTFTPNGDGINDYFFPKGVGIDPSDYDLWIFDRWGNLIWHTETWGEQWDGRANYGADVAQIDTYVWKVHVRELDSRAVHNYIGHVNIVK